ncbi:MAG: hypothetical protein M3Q81_01325 [bacterium]|nr:hypothetical protein [bacterium]
MSTLTNRLTDDQALSFIAKLEDLFSSLPKLPQGLIDFLVKIAPYLALLSAILSIIAGPILGIFGTLASLLSLSPLFLVVTLVVVVVTIVSAILNFMAYKPLLNRELTGWIYLFWVEILTIVMMLLQILVGQTTLISLVLALFWLYVLFQMKPAYTSMVQDGIIESKKKKN